MKKEEIYFIFPFSFILFLLFYHSLFLNFLPSFFTSSLPPLPSFVSSTIFLQCSRLFFLFFTVLFFCLHFLFLPRFTPLFFPNLLLVLYFLTFLTSIFSSSLFLSARICLQDVKGMNQVWRTRANPEYI